MAKVYVFLADGFEEIEALTVVDLLRRAKIKVEMISITDNLQVVGAHDIKVYADQIFDEATFEDADLLVLPGGMPGTNNLMEHEGLDRLLRSFHKEKKDMAAICAAPSILGKKNILVGKNATCYPGFEDKLMDSRVIDQDVVEDGNIVTSKGMGTAIDFSLAIIKRLLDEDTAKKIADSIIYRHYK